MYLEYIVYGLLFLAAAWMGYRRKIQLRHLNRPRLFRLTAIALTVLIGMSLLHLFGVFSQAAASRTTMGLYILAAGFFTGLGIKLIRIRSEAGNVGYMHRSFWTDIAPNFAAVLLVAFGIYRTGLLFFGPFTGIGITSGLSLVAFGFWGWTLSVVPEFREKGWLLLDEFIEWKRIIAYEWSGEDSLQIDYLGKNGNISSFTTYIPPEDQLIVERLLGKKMKLHEEERKKTVAGRDEK